MEKIFKDCRFEVADNGFSEKVLNEVVLHSVASPPPNMYRIPTLIASVCCAVFITVITLTVGIGGLNEKYNAFIASSDNHSSELNVDTDYYLDYEKDKDKDFDDFQNY